jgi:hypothetical protein
MVIILEAARDGLEMSYLYVSLDVEGGSDEMRVEGNCKEFGLSPGRGKRRLGASSCRPNLISAQTRLPLHNNYRKQQPPVSDPDYDSIPILNCEHMSGLYPIACPCTSPANMKLTHHPRSPPIHLPNAPPMHDPTGVLGAIMNAILITSGDMEQKQPFVRSSGKKSPFEKVIHHALQPSLLISVSSPCSRVAELCGSSLAR